jgi:hypothetical protein
MDPLAPPAQVGAALRRAALAPPARLPRPRGRPDHGPGPAGGCVRVAFSVVNRLRPALLCGCDGRLTTARGAFRPGQCPGQRTRVQVRAATGPDESRRFVQNGDF